MEARGQTVDEAPAGSDRRLPVWLLAALPLAIIIAAIAGFAALGGPGLGERVGPPVEELAVERTVLRPGEIELTVRNTGPDPVTVGQVFVADAYVDFQASERELGRLESSSLTLDYPWQEGSPYAITIVTSTGATIDHLIDVAVETPEASASFFGLMALLGIYVGIIPVVLGMLFLPLIRHVRESWVRAVMALTVGLLAFLAIDGSLEGAEIAATGSGAFGGVELLIAGAAIAYLALTGLDRWLAGRRVKAADAGASALRLSLMVAVGIGLHNLGEGLAIGSAYSLGALALGAFLVVGFAIQNTTEGLAIVAPLAESKRRPSALRLIALGLIAGFPAILGALIGASAYNAELATFLFGIGVGAIIQVIVQLTPSIRDVSGRALNPQSVSWIVAGMAVLYVTGLLVTV
ncbi:MAG: ZIP family metal transporter [Solirubrobacterales bacterium]